MFAMLTSLSQGNIFHMWPTERKNDKILNTLCEDKTLKNEQNTDTHTQRLLASPAMMTVTIGKHTVTIHQAASLSPYSQGTQPPSTNVFFQPQYVPPLMNTQAHFTSPVVNTQLTLLVVLKLSSSHLSLLSMYQVFKRPQMICWMHCLFPWSSLRLLSPLSFSKTCKEGLRTAVTFSCCHHNLKGEWIISVRLAREEYFKMEVMGRCTVSVYCGLPELN